MKSVVGAGIVEIITESLYDKPIVVFREYVQNSADAFLSVPEEDKNKLEVRIQCIDNNLCFVDNGTGIKEDKFEEVMVSIANSKKTRTKNIGYKGIGRLSGLSYCESLWFVNILSYSGKEYQIYKIDGKKYSDIKKSESFGELSFPELMSKIGCMENQIDQKIEMALNQCDSMFVNRNSGFLVILEGVSPILRKTIEDEQFVSDLGWLLPVPFTEKLDERGIFDKIATNIPAIKEGPYYKGVCMFKDSNVTIKIVAKCLEEDRFQVERDLKREYRKLIKEKGIDISYPQVVLNYNETKDIKVTKKDKVTAQEFVEEQKVLSHDLDDQDK